MMSTKNSEKKKIEKLKKEADKARDYLEAVKREEERAHEAVIKALIALSDAKGKVAPLSMQEEKVYNALRKVHHEEHEETTRWWCSHCRTTEITRKQRLENGEPEYDE